MNPENDKAKAIKQNGMRFWEYALLGVCLIGGSYHLDRELMERENHNDKINSKQEFVVQTFGSDGGYTVAKLESQKKSVVWADVLRALCITGGIVALIKAGVYQERKYQMKESQENQR